MRFWYALGLMVCGLIGLHAQQPFIFTQEDGPSLSILEKMDAMTTNGVSIAVMHRDTPILEKQWGYRDLENKRPVEVNTIFQVGSMAQPLTKFAILQLVSQGAFDLDTDINEYLQSWQFPRNRFTKKRPVTLRDLMLHRRGIKSPYKSQGFEVGEPVPSLLDLLNGTGAARTPAIRLKKDLNKSGNHTYAGSLIMQQILMDHYDMPFEELMERFVLEPLGMSDSFFAVVLNEEQLKRLAVGYDPNGKRVMGGYRRYPGLAASGLYTTATDYARFVQHCLDATNGLDNRFLSSDIAKEAFLNNNPEEDLLFNRRDNEYGWGGASYGYYTQFAADAENRDWVVVVLLNDHMNWNFNAELRYHGKLYLQAHQSPSNNN